MEKNFKRLIIANGVLFAFAILAMIVERATVPDQLARAMDSLYGSPSSILGDLLVLVFYLVVYLFGLYSAYNFQKLGRLILTATTIFIFYGCRFRSAFSSWFSGGSVRLSRTDNVWSITEFDVAFTFGTAVQG